MYLLVGVLLAPKYEETGWLGRGAPVRFENTGCQVGTLRSKKLTREMVQVG